MSSVQDTKSTFLLKNGGTEQRCERCEIKRQDIISKYAS